jgi:hypothetical protein
MQSRSGNRLASQRYRRGQDNMEQVTPFNFDKQIHTHTLPPLHPGTK